MSHNDQHLSQVYHSLAAYDFLRLNAPFSKFIYSINRPISYGANEGAFNVNHVVTAQKPNIWASSPPL